MKTIPGRSTFTEAFSRRATASWGGTEISVIGRDDLIEAKRASGRQQDLLDVELLERVPPG